jgi:hypothetical protein
MEPSPPVFFPMPISQKDIHVEWDEIGQKKKWKEGYKILQEPPLYCMVELELSVPRPIWSQRIHTA